MKQFFKFFAASLLAIVVSGVILMLVFFGMIGAAISSVSKKETVTIKDKSVLVVDLGQPIHELGRDNSLPIFGGEASAPYGLIDIVNSLREAKGDNNIKGVYIKASGGSNGWATMQAIRDAIKDFKKSGKFVYAYGDFISQRDYYVASVADSIFLNAIGMVELKGLASQITFFKGAMDKLGVKPQIFYCGQFKSATEPFRMQKMSDPNRRQLAAIQNDMWTEMLNAVSEHTKADTGTIFGWVREGRIQNAGDALQYRLVDGFKYRDQIEDLLKAKCGLKEKDKVRLTSLKDYASSLSDKNGGDQIAVLVGEGEIVEGAGSGGTFQIASEPFIKEIRRVRDNDNIKAVVLRVNSPGGSALASENILRELMLLKAKKKLVVSMGDLAASGGYYISSRADSIFAMPTTITGSIGVFGLMFNTQELFNNKLGITFDVQKNAPYADFPDMNRPMTEQEQKFMQAGVDTIYHVFKSHVAEGRKLDINYVDSIGQGRVWSGKAALDHKLIDAYGNLDRAIQSAATLAKVEKEYRVVVYPVVKDRMEQLMEMLNREPDKDAMMKIMADNKLSNDFSWYRSLKLLLSNNNHTWMMMPFIPEIG